MMQLGLDFSNTPPRAARSPGRKAEPARVRRTDPATSKAAAAKVERFASGHFAKILDALAELKTGTYREIAFEAGLEPVAVARRLNELERARKISRIGERDGFTVWGRA